MLVAGLMYISYDYFLKRDSQRTTKPFMAYAEVAADPFFFSRTCRAACLFH